MSVLYFLLKVEAALCVLFGLWSHNWTLIVAGCACWAIMPLVGKQLEEV